MQYFVVMIDYGRRGREAIVDPEVTRREVISRVASPWHWRFGMTLQRSM
jgi:hypothetical protein